MLYYKDLAEDFFSYNRDLTLDEVVNVYINTRVDLSEDGLKEWAEDNANARDYINEAIQSGNFFDIEDALRDACYSCVENEIYHNYTELVREILLVGLKNNSYKVKDQSNFLNFVNEIKLNFRLKVSDFANMCERIQLLHI